MYDGHASTPPAGSSARSGSVHRSIAGLQQRGLKLASGALDNLPAFFSRPGTAFAIGLALGVGLLLVSRASARLVTPEDPLVGMAKVAVAMVARMGAALAALLAYFVWARRGLAPFGVGLVVGFMVMVTVEVFRASRASRSVAEGGR